MKAEARELTRLICPFLNDHQIADARTETIKTLLLNQQREDFEKGRIVKVQGWILSETEARLCALTTLV
jgi:hypothetical protein